MAKAKQDSGAGPDRGRPDLEERLLPPVGSRAWRRIVAWFFLILGCLLIPLSVIGVWVRASVFDTDGFVDTLGPLASEPAVQLTVSDVLSSRVIEALNLETQLQELLPDSADFLAPVAAEQLNAWVRSQTEAVVASDEFAAVWTSALRVAHGTIADFLRGEGLVVLGPGGAVQLDLSPATVRIVDRLEQAGVPLPSGVRADLIDSKVSLVDVEGLDKVKQMLSLLDKVFILLPILTVIFLGGAVAVSDRRQKAAVRVGVGMMISTAVFIVVLALARVGLVSLISQAGPSTETGEAIWGNLTIAMRGTAWGLFVLGLLLSVHQRIIGTLRGQRLSGAAERAADSKWTQGAVPTWIAAQRRLIAAMLLILGVLTLVLWTGLGWIAVVTIGGIVILLEAAVIFVARAHDVALANESQRQEEASSKEPSAKPKPKSAAKPGSKSEQG